MADSIVTVTTAATNRKLTTLERAKAELSITGNSDDTLINAKIDEASAAVETYLNRPIVTEPVSEAFRLECALLWLQLDRWPVTTLTSVTEDDVALVLGTDYEVDASAGRIRRLCSGYGTWWPSSPLTTVVYTAGYVLPGTTGRTLPFDIEAATIIILRSAWLGRQRDPLVKREDHYGVGETEYWVNIDAANLPADARSLLDGHCRPNV